AAKIRAERVRADRTGDAHRSRGQERDPHRRVRQGRAGEGASAGGSSTRWSEAPVPARSDDLVRVHLWIASTLDCGRRGCPRATADGNDGDLGHDRRAGHRDAPPPHAVRLGGAREGRREEEGRGRGRQYPWRTGWSAGASNARALTGTHE